MRTKKELLNECGCDTENQARYNEYLFLEALIDIRDEMERLKDAVIRLRGI